MRNEIGYIHHSLNAVVGQNYPAEKIEVLVSDGMSDDGTREVVIGFQKLSSNMRLVDNPGRIVPTGMNTALRQARGEIIIRVDGHCIIAPDYVSRCVDHIEKDHVDGVGGSMYTIGDTLIAKTVAIAMSSKFGVGDSSFRTEIEITKEVDSVPFPAYTRNIIERVGLYDEELVRNQDDEYNYRIREMGGKILLAKDVKSTYYSRGTLKSLWKQYFQYGYWKVRVLQKHPRQMRWRQFVPPGYVGALVGSLVLSLLYSWGWELFALIVGLYTTTNIIASIITAGKKGWKYLPILPFTFATLHVSYGAGFLVGLVKFVNRWGDKIGRVPSFEIGDARTS